MKLQFRLTQKQADIISELFPCWEGGDLRDSIDTWVAVNIIRGAEISYSVDNNSIFKFIVDVSTKEEIKLNIESIYNIVSQIVISR